VPRSTKPRTIEQHNQAVANVAGRVQGAMRTAEPGQMAALWDSWPKLAGALAALDLELQHPIERAYGLPRSLG
jgi:hypothetical protein